MDELVLSSFGVKEGRREMEVERDGGRERSRAPVLVSSVSFI